MRHKEGDKAKDIMDSATALFAKRGFHSAGVSDIAAGARVSAGCIYLYFKDKSDVLARILDRFWTDLDALAAEAFAREGTVLERAAAYIRSILAYCADHPELSGVYLHEMPVYWRVKGEERTPWHQLMDSIDAFFQEGLKTAIFSEKLSPQQFRLFVLGCFHAMVQHGYRRGFPPDERENWLDSSVQLILHGLSVLAPEGGA